jgi:hypothetical protein
MKTRIILLVATALASLFTGCVKDKLYKTYTITTAEYVIKPEVISAARVQSPRAMVDARGFALYGTTMFMNERDKGIHVIDCGNPSSPKNVGFIPIPGNTGVSIKNGVMYADCYCDLFVFKLSGNNQVEFQSAVREVFSSRMSHAYDPSYVDIIYHHRDTTVTERAYNEHMAYNMKNADGPMVYLASNANPGPTSVGSSLAVFALVGDYLYIVDNSNLNTFSLADPMNPKKLATTVINFGMVETIYPFAGNLFVGTSNGMFVYGLDNPGNPQFRSRFDHARVCDPVIAEEKYAFVTLRAGSGCGGAINQLDVVDITDIQSPRLVRSYSFTNPHGLSKDGNVLFICDGTAGLRVLDATNVNNIVTKQTLQAGEAVDVIAMGSKAYVTLKSAVQIYSYDQQFNVQLLGTLNKN